MLSIPATIYYPKMAAITNLLMFRRFLTLPSRLAQFYKTSAAKELAYRIDLMNYMATHAPGTFDALDEVKTGMKGRTQCTLRRLQENLIKDSAS
jgi:hypothetical protein